MLTNVKQFFDGEIVLLFKESNFTVPIYLRDKYGVSVFTFTPPKPSLDYLPAIRPYLWWKYLEAHPEAENETYLYIDSDVIFREWPDFDSLPVDGKTWFGSDCASYIAYDYIKQCQRGEAIAGRMAEICGITIDQLKNTAGAGAQWLIQNPTAAFWKRSYEDSNKLYDYLRAQNSDIQHWTAEMWAQLFGMTREGITVTIDKELDFCMSTDPVEKFEQVKILHNAGVTEAGPMFFKGQYDKTSPLGQDFPNLDPKKASIKYVEALKRVVV